MTSAGSLQGWSGKRRASVVPNPGTCSGRRLPNLLFEHFLDLPDLCFNFADVVFGFAFKPLS